MILRYADHDLEEVRHRAVGNLASKAAAGLLGAADFVHDGAAMAALLRLSRDGAGRGDVVDETSGEDRARSAREDAASDALQLLALAAMHPAGKSWLSANNGATAVRDLAEAAETERGESHAVSRTEKLAKQVARALLEVDRGERDSTGDAAPDTKPKEHPVRPETASSSGSGGAAASRRGHVEPPAKHVSLQERATTAWRQPELPKQRRAPHTTTGFAPGRHVVRKLPEGLLPRAAVSAVAGLGEVGNDSATAWKGSVASRGWCFPWVTLSKPDEQALFDLHIQFKLRDARTLSIACQQMRGLFLNDFPAEVFLQHPALLQHLLACLRLPAVDGAKGAAGAGKEELDASEFHVFEHAMAALRAFLQKLRSAVRAYVDPDTRPPPRVAPRAAHSGADAMDNEAGPFTSGAGSPFKQPRFVRTSHGTEGHGTVARMRYPPARFVETGTPDAPADETATRPRLSLADMGVLLFRGAAPLLKDITRLSSVVALLVDVVPFLTELTEKQDTDGAAARCRLDSERLATCLSQLEEAVSFYSADLGQLMSGAAAPRDAEKSNGPGRLVPLIKLAVSVLVQVEPDRLSSKPPAADDVAFVPPALLRMFSQIIMAPGDDEELRSLADALLPYINNLDADTAVERDFAERMVDIVEDLRTISADTSAASAETVVRTVSGALEGLLYVPEETVVSTAIDACMAILCGPVDFPSADRGSSNMLDAEDLLLRLLAFPKDAVRAAAYDRLCRILDDADRDDSLEEESPRTHTTRTRRVVRTILMPNVVYQILAYGFADVVVQKDAWSLMGKVALVAAADASCLESLVPVASLLQAHAALPHSVPAAMADAQSKIAALAAVVTDTAPVATRLVAHAQLLFHSRADFRRAAAAALRGIPLHEADAEEALSDPVWSIIHDAYERRTQSTPFAVSDSAAAEFGSRDVAGLWKLAASPTLEGELRLAAAQQLCSMLSHPFVLERSAADLPDMSSGIVDLLRTTARQADAAPELGLVLLQLHTVIASGSSEICSAIAESEGAMRTLVEFIFSDDAGMRLAAARSLACVLFNDQLWRAAASRREEYLSAEVVRYQSVNRGASVSEVIDRLASANSVGEAPLSGSQERPPGTVAVVPAALASFGVAAVAAGLERVRCVHLRSAHADGAAWTLAAEARPRVLALVKYRLGLGDTLKAGAADDGLLAGPWDVSSQALALLQRLSAATSHAEFRAALSALQAACDCDAACARAVAVGDWRAHLARFLETTPTSPKDDGALTAVIELLTTLVPFMRTGSVLQLLAGVRDNLVHLLRRPCASESLRGQRRGLSGEATDDVQDREWQEILRGNEYEHLGSFRGSAGADASAPRAVTAPVGRRRLRHSIIALVCSLLRYDSFDRQDDGKDEDPAARARAAREVAFSLTSDSDAVSVLISYAGSSDVDHELRCCVLQALAGIVSHAAAVRFLVATPISSEMHEIVSFSAAPPTDKKCPTEELLRTTVFIVGKHRAADGFAGKAPARLSAQILASLAPWAPQTPEQWWLDHKSLAWLHRLGSDREASTRACGFALQSGLIASQWGRSRLLHSSDHGDIPSSAMRVLFDVQECGVVRAEAASVLCSYVSSCDAVVAEGDDDTGSADGPDRAIGGFTDREFTLGTDVSAQWLEPFRRMRFFSRIGDLLPDTTSYVARELTRLLVALAEISPAAIVGSLFKRDLWPRLLVLLEDEEHQERMERFAEGGHSSPSMLLARLRRSMWAGVGAPSAATTQTHVLMLVRHALAHDPMVAPYFATSSELPLRIVRIVAAEPVAPVLARTALLTLANMLTLFKTVADERARRADGTAAMVRALSPPPVPSGESAEQLLHSLPGALCVSLDRSSPLSVRVAAASLLAAAAENKGWRSALGIDAPNSTGQSDAASGEEGNVGTLARQLASLFLDLHNPEFCAQPLVGSDVDADALASGGLAPDAFSATASESVTTPSHSSGGFRGLDTVASLLGIVVQRESDDLGPFSDEILFPSPGSALAALRVEAAAGLRSLLEAHWAARETVLRAGIVGWALRRISDLREAAVAAATQVGGQRSRHSAAGTSIATSLYDSLDERPARAFSPPSAVLQRRRQGMETPPMMGSHRVPRTASPVLHLKPSQEASPSLKGPSVRADSVGLGSDAVDDHGRRSRADTIGLYLAVMGSCLAGSEDSVATEAESLRFPALLQSLLTLFARDTDALQAVLRVIVNYASHGELIKRSLLLHDGSISAPRSVGGSGSAERAATTPGSASVLHSLMQLARKQPLDLEAYRLCCLALCSLAYSPECQAAMLRAHFVDEQVNLLKRRIARHRYKQLPNARIAAVLDVMTALAHNETGQVAVLRGTGLLDLCMDIVDSARPNVRCAVVRLLRNCAFCKSNIAHFVSDSSVLSLLVDSVSDDAAERSMDLCATAAAALWAVVYHSQKAKGVLTTAGMFDHLHMVLGSLCEKMEAQDLPTASAEVAIRSLRAVCA